MKKTVITIGFCVAMALALSAAPPIPRHPPAPPVTAIKAVEIAVKFAGPDPASVRYCSSVTLVEGGMTPAPNGSARHWLVTFQDAGGMRHDLRQVYVNMDGIASDAVPPLSK
jgi:hypothetical protein